MFAEIFDALHARVPEIRVTGVWGIDGLELEKRVYADMEVNFDFLGAEVADIITKINGIHPTPESVKVRLDLEAGWLYIFRLTPDFFLIILAEPGVLNGRVNFYADLFRSRLAEML